MMNIERLSAPERELLERARKAQRFAMERNQGRLASLLSEMIDAVEHSYSRERESISREQSQRAAVDELHAASLYLLAPPTELQEELARRYDVPATTVHGILADTWYAFRRAHEPKGS